MEKSKYLNPNDLSRIDYKFIADEMVRIYNGGLIHTYGARSPESVRIHWSREWEYPWAILSSGVCWGDSIVDLGCGGSPLPIFLANKGCKVFCMDSVDVTTGSNPSLRSWGRLPQGIHFQKGDFGQSIPFDKESFQVVFCISVLETFPTDQLRHLYEEIFRVLKKGGRCIITLDIGRNGSWGENVLNQIIELCNNTGRFEILYDIPFLIPDINTLPGLYHIVGLSLAKSK